MQTLFKKSINLILKILWPPGSRFFLLPTFLKTDFFALAPQFVTIVAIVVTTVRATTPGLRFFFVTHPLGNKSSFFGLIATICCYSDQCGNNKEGTFLYIYTYIYIHIYVYMVLWVQIPLRPTFYSYFKESLYR